MWGSTFLSSQESCGRAVISSVCSCSCTCARVHVCLGGWLAWECSNRGEGSAGLRERKEGGLGEGVAKMPESGSEHGRQCREQSG